MADYKTISIKLNNGILPSMEELKSQHPFAEDILKRSYVTYIYYNLDNKVVYIGKAAGKEGFIQRHKQHLGEKTGYNYRDYTDVLVMFGDLLDNESAILLLEHLIIKYMFAEVKQTKFKILNGNESNQQVYYGRRKEVIEKVFNRLWQNELRNLNLIKNENLKEIRNTFVFKYSPFQIYGESQLKVIDEITSNNTDNFLVLGRAGTGKSVLFTGIGKILADRHLEEENYKIALLTTPHVKESVAKIFELLDLAHKVKVTTPAMFIQENIKYNLVVVDEAHKLNRYYETRYGHAVTKRHLKEEKHELYSLIELSQQLVILFDPNQAIKPQNILPSEILYFTDRFDFKKLELSQQFRIKGNGSYSGEDYLKGILYGLGLSNDTTFNPEVFNNSYFGVVDCIEDLFVYIDHANDLRDTYANRVIAGYARKWISKKEKFKSIDLKERYEKRPFDWKNETRKQLEVEGWRWNYSNKNWITSKNSKIEVGSIHAIQNVDLNHVGVIVGNDLKVEEGELIADPKNYFDLGGNPDDNPLSNEQLTEYIKNIYYVLLTRGIDSCRVYFENKDVKELFFERIKDGISYN